MCASRGSSNVETAERGTPAATSSQPLRWEVWDAQVAEDDRHHFCWGERRLNHVPSPRGATPRQGGAPQTGAQQAILARAGRASVRRLRLRWWFAPLLTALTLVCAVSLIGVAYLGAQANALAAAQARDGQGALTASALLTTNGSALSVDNNGQLVTSVNGSSLILAHDASALARLHALLGEGVVIYQAHNGALTAIATSADLTGALGGAPDAAASAALIGQCGAASHAGCHQAYSGETQARGVGYVAGFAPLFDLSGAFVGAVAALTPLATVMAPPMQLLVTLSLVGLLVTLAALATGLGVFGAFAGRGLETVSARLAVLGAVAANVEEAVYTHAVRAQRQERMGRLLADDAYHLDAVANALEQGHAALQEEVNSVWAGISQPGIAPDPQTMLRLARQTAVAAAHIGADAEDAASLSRQMTPLMNTLIAEDHALAESAQATERLASELRAALDQVEMALGARLAPRPQRARSGLLHRARAVSQRLRQTETNPQAHNGQAARRRPAPPDGYDPRRSATGDYGVRRGAPNTPGSSNALGGKHRPTDDYPTPRQSGEHQAPRRRPTGAPGWMPTPSTPSNPSNPSHPSAPSQAPQGFAGAQGGYWTGENAASSSARWRMPITGEQPFTPWTPEVSPSPWDADAPDATYHPGTQYPWFPGSQGRAPHANDTDWLNA